MVGVSALFPGSISRQGFWQNILAGKDLVSDVPPSHWLIEDYYDADPQARDKTYARRGAFLPDVDFDPVAWGVPPSILPTTDTNQLLALIVAQQVLDDACRGQFQRINRERVSVILGVTSAQELLGNMVSRLQRPVWVKALREMGLPESQVVQACDRIASNYVEWNESTFPGVLGNVVAGRIANRLDLGGTNCITDAACASSFSALSMAVNELRLGQSDLVITGGADTMNDIFMYVCFSKTPALSPTGDCRPFSDQADGTLLGEGLGMVALKRLADAERDGDHIYALVKGVGSSSDGRSKSVYAPVSAGQAVALRRAYEQAGFGAHTIELMEAHGTGTKAGDAAEFGGLRMVFEESGSTDTGWCALGSVKSQVGHTKAAAGAAGLFKAVMALHHKVLPPTIKVQKPDPKLQIDSTPFYLNTVARPWVRGNDHPRRAAVSSFGFGGSNFHVALEEYQGPAQLAARDLPPDGHLLLLAGGSGQAVAARCDELASQAREFASHTPDPEAQHALLAFWAHDSQTNFEPNPSARLAVFATNLSELQSKLAQAATVARQERSVSVPGGLEFAMGQAAGDVAFLFPGQGSQYLNMAADVVMAFAPAQQAWDAAASLERELNTPSTCDERLDRVVFPRPAFDETQTQAQRERLLATQWAQPALGVTSWAYLNVLRTLGLMPTAVAGHSFGEVTALFAAGVLSEADFVAAARQRGQVMAQAAQAPGAMLSVAAPLAEVQAHLQTAGHQGPEAAVVVANHNSPRQVVVSGQTQAITELETQLSSQGVSATRLDVATAFHSPVVSAARVPFSQALGSITFSPAACPVYANATAAPYPNEPEAMRTLLADQLASSVRFVEQIEAMYAQGVRTFVEVGPGHVLTALVGHILKDKPHRAIALNRKGRSGVAMLWQGLGALAAAGVSLDFAALWVPFAVPADPRLKTKPALTLKVNGAGYGKPYPPPGGAAALPKPNPEQPTVAPAPVAPAPVAPAPTQAPVSAGMDPQVQYAWVMAISESQRQTAEAHAAFQRAMAESHTAFLRAAESSLMGLTHALGGQAYAAPAYHAFAAPPIAQYVPAPTALYAPPAFMPPAPPAPVYAAAPPAPTYAPAAAPVPQPPVYSAAPSLAPAQPAPSFAAAPPPQAAPAQATSASNGNGHTQPATASLTLDGLQALMLNVVAARTGYPEEMLGLDMDLEADLGVDSIKRVEILSAVMERAPGLPDVNTAKLASMRTLREIVNHLGQEGGLGATGAGSNGAHQATSNGATEGAPRPLAQKAP